jgi:hypothetical protein
VLPVRGSGSRQRACRYRTIEGKGRDGCPGTRRGLGYSRDRGRGCGLDWESPLLVSAAEGGNERQHEENDDDDDERYLQQGKAGAKLGTIKTHEFV